MKLIIKIGIINDIVMRNFKLFAIKFDENLNYLKINYSGIYSGISLLSN